jgi:hypothetical protein
LALEHRLLETQHSLQDARIGYRSVRFDRAVNGNLVPVLEQTIDIAAGVSFGRIGRDDGVHFADESAYLGAVIIHMQMKFGDRFVELAVREGAAGGQDEDRAEQDRKNSIHFITPIRWSVRL